MSVMTHFSKILLEKLTAENINANCSDFKKFYNGRIRSL